MAHKALKSSGNNEWETPSRVFHDWCSRFLFTLDVCASENNAKCENYYTKKHNGLIQPWHDRNWCNPPYGRGLIEPWLKKAVLEARKGHLTCMLLPVATATQWWQKYVLQSDHIYYYPHRINFLRDGVEVKGVSFDPCIAIFGLHPYRRIS